MNTKWDLRFMDLARLVASWSKDPSTQCGAVIVDTEKRVVSMGFNGFPRGIDDSDELLLDRDEKYKRVIHSEVNALTFANREVDGCTMYVWPMPPCSRCAAQIIQNGITKIVTLNPTKEQRKRWGDDFITATTMFNEAQVCIKYLD